MARYLLTIIVQQNIYQIGDEVSWMKVQCSRLTFVLDHHDRLHVADEHVASLFLQPHVRFVHEVLEPLVTAAIERLRHNVLDPCSHVTTFYIRYAFNATSYRIT